jgi:hypothetical protein
MEQEIFKIIELDKNLFDGYLSEVGTGVYISAITSKQIGKGNFSKLIKELKLKYDFIKIPTPSNMMGLRAKHLGFIEKEEYFGEPFNSMGKVMLWEK